MIYLIFSIFFQVNKFDLTSFVFEWINVKEYRRDNQKLTKKKGEIGNIGYTRQRQTKHKHNMICVRYH